MNLVKSQTDYFQYFFFNICLCENRKYFHRKLFNIIYIFGSEYRTGHFEKPFNLYIFFLLFRLNYVKEN